MQTLHQLGCSAQGVAEVLLVPASSLNAIHTPSHESILGGVAVVSDVITTLVAPTLDCFISGLRRAPTMVLAASTRASPSDSLLALLG